MRGFFGITRVFMTPVVKQGFRFQNQQQVQMRILLNRFNQLLRMSTSIQGLRLANVFDQSMFSDLEDAQGKQQIEFVLDDSKDLETRQIGLHLGCTI